MTNDDTILQAANTKASLLTDFLLFTKTFFKLRTGRDFRITYPIARESHYKTIARALYRVYLGKCNKLIINIPPRYGKALDVNTEMLTKDGFKLAKDITTDDYLLGSKGWTKVTGVYPQGILDAKEVSFGGEQTIVCNKEHLWSVTDRYTPHKVKTLTTEQIENTIHEADGRKHWRIPMINGNYGHVKPFINPYLFGLWLGDGTSTQASITTMDKEVAQAFSDDGHVMKNRHSKNCGRATCYGITQNGFIKTLRLNNQINNKHIPDCVMLWSKEDRLSLLQGLMDSDGTANKKNGQISFCNKRESILNGFYYLVNSLGGTYRIYNHLTGAKVVNIRLPDDISPFRLERQKKYVSKGKKCAPRRFFNTIVDVEPREMVCFSVDAEDKLFAAGRGLILTHNTSLLMNFVAWALANHPDSNFLYISVSHDLATRATAEIRSIINTAEYKKIFGISLRGDSNAKDSFMTTNGGSIEAIGAQGTIVGKGAGVRDADRFGGSIIIDDVHKPDEATSDTIREGVINWFYNTLLSRRNNGEKTPIIYIGQRVHEMDLAAHLIEQGGWEVVSLPAIDECGNALCPDLHTIQELKAMQALEEYVFAAQFQQNPQPAGGGLFKITDFPILDYTPNILMTFITVDTAETAKEYNDATAFSLWGVYEIEQFGNKTGLYALHWLNCVEIFVEPKDLQAEFMSFYGSSFKSGMLPSFAIIEKKSTGTTLVSVLKDIQGLNIMSVDRTSASGSKIDRHISMQKYIANKQISLPYGAQHTKMCIEHMRKIAANGTQRRSDICDTVFDAVKCAFIDKTALGYLAHNHKKDNNAKIIFASQKLINQSRQNIWH